MKQAMFALVLTASTSLASVAASADTKLSCVAFIEGAAISKKASIVALAEAKPFHVEPANVVDNATKALLGHAREKGDVLKSDPDTYFKDVSDILDSAVDFLRIAKNVMGKKNWLAATPAQREEFVSAFKRYLVRFYGKGLQPYINLDIDLESSCLRQGKSSVYVQQKVKTGSGITRLVYTMKQADNSWKLINVQFDGVNMGKTFKTQFQQLVDENKGDVGLAISSWIKQQS